MVSSITKRGVRGLFTALALTLGAATLVGAGPAQARFTMGENSGGGFQDGPHGTLTLSARNGQELHFRLPLRSDPRFRDALYGVLQPYFAERKGTFSDDEEVGVAFLFLVAGHHLGVPAAQVAQDVGFSVQEWRELADRWDTLRFMERYDALSMAVRDDSWASVKAGLFAGPLRIGRINSDLEAMKARFPNVANIANLPPFTDRDLETIRDNAGQRAVGALGRLFESIDLQEIDPLLMERRRLEVLLDAVDILFDPEMRRSSSTVASFQSPGPAEFADLNRRILPAARAELARRGMADTAAQDAFFRRAVELYNHYNRSNPVAFAPVPAVGPAPRSAP